MTAIVVSPATIGLAVKDVDVEILHLSCSNSDHMGSLDLRSQRLAAAKSQIVSRGGLFVFSASPAAILAGVHFKQHSENPAERTAAAFEAALAPFPRRPFSGEAWSELHVRERFCVGLQARPRSRPELADLTFQPAFQQPQPQPRTLLGQGRQDAEPQTNAFRPVGSPLPTGGR